MQSDDGKPKKCTYCGEEIGIYARRCPFCGSLNEVVPRSFYPSIPSMGNGFQNNREVQINHHTGDGEANAPQQTDKEGILKGQQTIPPVSLSKPGHNLQEVEAGTGNPGSGTLSDFQREGASTGTPAFIYNPRNEAGNKKPLSNGMKVFLTSVCNLVPGIGQVIGIILAIIFMSNETDEDRKSFGLALLITSMIVFVISMFSYFILFVILVANTSTS